MLLEDGRVDGSEGCEVVADARIGDHEIELGDALGLDGGDSCGRVRLALVVDLHHNDFAGRVGGEGGEFLGGRMFGVADAGNDGCVWAGKVDFDEASSDACTGLWSA